MDACLIRCYALHSRPWPQLPIAGSVEALSVQTCTPLRCIVQAWAVKMQGTARERSMSLHKSLSAQLAAMNLDGKEYELWAAAP